MGGRPYQGPIDRSEHTLMDWERRTNALVGVLREKRLINTDERAARHRDDPAA